MSETASIRVEFDAQALIRRYQSQEKAAQTVLDELVIADTDPYVRYRTGALARSVQTASHVGKGLVIYDTPYARRVYYDTHSAVTRDVHPDATPLWFEESKRRNLASWRDAVARMLAEGRRS